MTKFKILIFLGLVLPLSVVILSFTFFRDTNNPVFNSLILKFESYYKRLPQYKVFLHLDKSDYKADEILWFKAYHVSAMDNKPDSSTTNLYVDLVNPSGYVVQSALIRLTDGFGNGYFGFRDTIPEGVYKIRAFTNWMRNLDEDYFFESQIYIANPEYKTYVTKEDVLKIKKAARKNKRMESKFDVQFLPEGGHLLTDVENKLGIKALNELGQGIPVKGRIVDSKENEISSFSCSDLGIGSVSFSPREKEAYTAIVEIAGKSIKVKLPEAINMGINISSAKSSNDKLLIKLLSNFPEGQLPPNTSYFLFAHCRGKILFTREFDLKNKDNSVEISTKDFPTGIVHLSLFNINSQVVSERLVFVNNDDFLNITLESSKLSAGSREKITVNARVTDKKGNPVEGNFSLSASKSEESYLDNNIISELYFNSDLKGIVESPSYYFTELNEEKEKQLDDLMLTQGWRRYNWPTVLSDVKIPPEFEQEKGIAITGRITKEFFDIPLRDISVKLSILNEFNDVFTTRSGEKGIFRFENLDYSDTVSVSIEARKANGKKNLLILIDAKEEDKDKNMHYQTEQILKRRGPKGQIIEEEPEFDPYAEKNNRISRIHNEPSGGNVIIIDDKTQNYQSIGQVLEGRVAGVMVSGNRVIIRGINTMYGNTDPLFLLDGVPIDPDFAMSMSPYDVERIEVLKGPETAIYGSRGSNGVIAIYSKRGKFMKKGAIDFRMLGYQSPREYYNPKYTSKSDDIFPDDRRTIAWIPTLKTDAKGQGNITFYTSDTKGDFIIRMEGIGNNGIPGYKETKMEVK